MATIVELMVELGLKDDGFEAGMKEAPKEADKAVGGIKDKFKGLGDKLAPVAKAAGVAAGAAVVAGALIGIEQEAVTDKLAAQLNLSESESELAGSIAGKLYAQAYGESFEDITETVGEVLGTFEGLTAESVERVAVKAADLEAAFDIEDAVSRAGVLVKTGLARDVDHAMDLIAASMQEVAPGLRDELGEATTEYSKFFADLGFTGEETFALLAAADDKFSLDKTGDAIKELSIRATDGSTSTQEAFAAMGMNADLMALDIARGGEDARAAFDMIVDGLLDIRDPAKRAQTAVALFGTPVEDLSVAQIPEFLSSLQGVGDGLGDVEGRADRLGDTLNDNAQTKITTFKRSIEQTLARIVEMPGPIGTASTAIAGMGQAVAPVAPALTGLAVVFQGKLGSIVKIATGAFSKVGAAFGALSKLVMANPWVALIAATIALVTLIVANWDKIKAFLAAVWDWIKRTVAAVADWFQRTFGDALAAVGKAITGWISSVKKWFSNVWTWIRTTVSDLWSRVKSIFKAGLDALVNFVLNWTLVGRLAKHWDAIKEGVSKVKQWFVDRWNDIIGFFERIPGRIGAAARGMWDGIKEAFRGVINTIIGWWNNFHIELTVPTNSFTELIGLAGKGFRIDTPNIPKLHDGGIVPGVPGTEVPVILEAGERVIPRDQAGGPLAGATFVIQGLPETVAQDVGRRVGMEVRWATG